MTNKLLFLRSSVIGLIIGMIPGLGGTPATFISYFQAVNTSKNPESFGTGDPRGVIAAEAANDAKDGGSYIPTLGFGIPGSPSMVIFLGAFMIHGIMPGPFVITDHLDIVVMIIVATGVANIISSTIVLLFSNRLTAITKIKPERLAPTIIIFTFLGAYVVNGIFFDMIVALIFGVLGFFMLKLDISRIPLILAMVLVPITEDNYWISMQISGGEHNIFFNSLSSLLLISIIVLTILIPIVRANN